MPSRTFITRAPIILAITAAILAPLPAFAAIPSVNVPRSCTVVDTDGTSHTYEGQYRGICALAAAKEQGAVSAYTLQNFSFGLFLASLNGIVPGETEFWSLSQNGVEASVGLSDMVVAEGDTLSFQLTDWSIGEKIGSPVEFSIALVTPEEPAPTGGGLTFFPPDFDPTKAVLFLKSAQSIDGALPNALLSDWAAFAFTSHDIGDARAKLHTYFLTWKPDLSSVTDYERHAMALLALNINPYNVGGIDYITPIVEAFDGEQVGSTSLVNDDIFAIFPLLNAGYHTDDEILRAIRDHIVAAQRPNGSWEDSVDLTAAAVQALSLFARTGDTAKAIWRGESYLAAQQQDDGGFGNSFSTAWALQAIAAIGNSHVVWTKSSYKTPRYYFAEQQADDGGVEADAESFTRLWATAYAVPAVKGHTWDSLMASFPEPAPQMAASEATLATTTEVVCATVEREIAQTEAVSDLPSELPLHEQDDESAGEESQLDIPQEAQAASAAASETIEQNGLLLWFAGLGVILLASVYLLRFRNA